MHLLVMPTSTPDVVAIDGCLLGGRTSLLLLTHVSHVHLRVPFFPPLPAQQWLEKPMIARVLAAMLDQGTKRRTKFEVSEKLEGMGASVQFWPTEWHLNWGTKCLRCAIALSQFNLEMPYYRLHHCNR